MQKEEKMKIKLKEVTKEFEKKRNEFEQKLLKQEKSTD